MKGKRKPFNRETYDRCDGAAKSAVAVHLTHHGYDVEVPPENYGADLYHRMPHDAGVVYHEVEVSLGWGDVLFPYPTGSIPERKIRLTKVCIGPLFFWMLNRPLNRAIVFSSAYLRPEFLVEVPNKEIESGEYFYRPPIKYARLVDLMKGENNGD